MNAKIWLSSPHMGTKEAEYVAEAFATNWIAPLGPHVDGFEKELAQYNKTQHVAVLSSGTAALHLSLILLGVGRDDIVLCQSFTFSASANPIAYLGAQPVFIDSESSTWNMDPEALETAIKHYIEKNKKPKAIIAVHLYGMPAQMHDIMSIAQRYDIPVIEDAAEALGSTYHQQYCGTFGDLGIYSFNGNKIITTSGGGALVSNNKDWIEKARFLSTQARDNAPHYEHSHIGYNYRMSNVCAGIGRGQLEVLPERIAQRRKNFNYYKQALAGLPIHFLEEMEGSFSNRWLTCVTFDDALKHPDTREAIRLALLEDNIEARPLWKPMHLQPVFKAAPYFGGNIAASLFEKGLCLPSGSNLEEADLYRVCNIIKEKINYL
ncbi:MAG: DegT/DnrJ/EryC1/StrS family aminotransferase [Ferruginibacter sp.]